MHLREGKLPPNLLAELISCTSRSPEILVEAAVGEDAAVVMGRDRIVVTSDPVTFTEDNIGIYTVAVNCNDIVAMGGDPRYLTTTVLLPVGTTEERLKEVFADLEVTARKAGILWIGGHTEVTSAVNRIVVSGHAVGFLYDQPLTSAGAEPGDALVMTKWAGLEGTTLIARSRADEAREILGRDAFREVFGWLMDPGISIVEEGRILAGLTLTAGHDPTEGGIATGVYEIATRSEVGVELQWERINIRPETERLCAEWEIDPLGLLSSGVFLFCAQQETAQRACELLAERGIDSRIIGRVTDKAGEVTVLRGSQKSRLPQFERDEFLKIED